jgi:hypothetical protein
MHFIVTGTVVPSEDMDAHRPEEIRVFEELIAEGVIQEVFHRSPGPGVINVVEAPGLAEAQSQLDRLPFVKLGFLTFEYAEVVKVR